MGIDATDILCVRVPPGVKFKLKEGLYPIVAGYGPDGQPRYCAELYYCSQIGYDKEIKCDIRVAEGT